VPAALSVGDNHTMSQAHVDRFIYLIESHDWLADALKVEAVVDSASAEQFLSQAVLLAQFLSLEVSAAELRATLRRRAHEAGYLCYLREA